MSCACGKCEKSEKSESKKDGVNVTYVRDADNHPVGCVAFRLHPNAVEYGFSFCSHIDQFSRKIGRNIATGRLNKKPEVLSLTGEAFESGAVCSILKALAKNPKVPNHARPFIKPILDKWEQQLEQDVIRKMVKAT